MARTLYLGTIGARRHTTTTGTTVVEYIAFVVNSRNREEMVGAQYARAEEKWPRRDGWEDHCVVGSEISMGDVLKLAYELDAERAAQIVTLVEAEVSRTAAAEDA